MDRPLPSRLTFDEVCIDLEGHRLSRGGTAHALEPKAFGVLSLLAQSPGRVFTRDEILDAVWGHRHVTPGVLNRVVTLLRHALGEDAHAPRYLHTVHGVGYRLDADVHAKFPTETVPDAGRSDGTAAPVDAPPEAGSSARIADGVPRRRRGDDRRRPTSRSPGVGVLLLLLVVLAAAGWRLWPDRVRASPAGVGQAVPADVRSVAVLPMSDAAGDSSQRFFSDGVSENLINALARVDGLKVIGRTSSFRFRDGSGDSKAIGQALGVDYLVSGSTQRSGDAVRISIELVSTRDGHAVWTEHYDRPYRDLFALQDEIAAAVASALRTRLLPATAARTGSDRPPGGAMEAYHAYLRGMQAFYDQDFPESARHHAEAVALDPRYAAAWAQLAVASALVGYGETGTPARQAFARARSAADRALALAPDLGIAHAARGNLLLGADFDWNGALAELRTGTRLDPDNGPIHGALSRALAATGELQEALVERRHFLASEPLLPFNHLLFSDLQLANGQPDLADASARTAEALQERPLPSFQRMYVAIVRNDATAAHKVASMQRPGWREMDLALVAQLAPESDEASATLQHVLAQRTWATTSAYVLAQAYALRGDPESMLQWLQEAWRRRDPNLHRLLYDPILLRFRHDARLAAFCAEIGLPSPDLSEALDIDRIRASLRTAR